MVDTNLSLRQRLRKAQEALEYEHAAEMLSPLHKLHVLDNGEQANVSFLGPSQTKVFMRKMLSRVNFFYDPVAMLKKRVVRLRAYSSR